MTRQTKSDCWLLLAAIGLNISRGSVWHTVSGLLTGLVKNKTNKNPLSPKCEHVIIPGHPECLLSFKGNYIKNLSLYG